MWKLRHYSWLRGNLVRKVRTQITSKVDGDHIRQVQKPRSPAWLDCEQVGHLPGPGCLSIVLKPLSGQHQDHWFHFFITRCGTSSFRRLFRKRGDDTFKKLSGAWHPPKLLFWGSGVLFSVFLAYCIDLLDFGFWTSIFKLPSSGKIIFQRWSTFLQYRFFYQHLPNCRWCDALELGEQVLPAFKRFHGEKVGGRSFP